MSSIIKKNLFSFVSLFIVAVLSIIVIISLVSQKKIGFVDNRRVLEEYNLTGLVKNEIQTKAGEAQGLINELQQELDGLRDRFIKQSDTLTEKEKNELKNEILTKETEYNNNVNTIKNQLPEYEKKMMAAVISDINTKISQYGRENGFQILFGATEYGNIVYADKAVDLTGSIILYLNSPAKVKQQETEKDSQGEE